MDKEVEQKKVEKIKKIKGYGESWWNITTLSKNTLLCLCHVAGQGAKSGCLFVCFILINLLVEVYLLRSVIDRVTLLTLWIWETFSLQVYANFIMFSPIITVYKQPALEAGFLGCLLRIQIPGSHSKFI